MVVQKLFIVRAEFDDAFGNAGKQRQVAADVRLHVHAGDVAAEQQATHVARHVESHQASFNDRIDDDHLAAAAADVQQRAHQPRMVAGRVAADEEYEVGVFQVFELDRRRAAAGDARQSNAAGLVAVVTAVVDVVRAVKAGEKLQQKTGFVAAAAAEVPERFVRRRGAELRDDSLERFVPGDRRVAAGVARVANRLDEPAAGFELARRKLLQIACGILLPEVAVDGALHVGDHRLQAFFADFRKVAQLVDHAAALAAHAQRAGLAGILAAHGPPELEDAAGLAGLLPGVPNSGPTAAGFQFLHSSINDFTQRRSVTKGLRGVARYSLVWRKIG